MAEVLTSWDAPASAPPTVTSWDTGGKPPVVTSWEPKKKGAEPGSLSYAVQGAFAPFETVASILSQAVGMAGGALVGGARAPFAGSLEGAAAEVRGGMQAGAQTMSWDRFFAPTPMFEEIAGHIFEAVKEGAGQGMELIEGARGAAAKAITPKAVHGLVGPQTEAARTLGEYAVEAPAVAFPAIWLRSKMGKRPDRSAEPAAEPPPRPEDTPIQPEGPGPTGTPSGVPVKMDALIAEAQRNAEGIPEAPRNVVKTFAKEADRVPPPPVAPGGLPIDALIKEAQTEYQMPVPPKNLAKEAIPYGARQQGLGLEGALQPGFAPGRAEGAVPRPPVEPMSTPPRGQPAAAGEAAKPDFFLEESPYQIDVPRAEVRGGEAHSGGEARKVFETVRFSGQVDQLLANAGRDWKLPERQDAAMRELKNVVDQLPPEHPLAPLRGMTYDQLGIAAKQYWREAREGLLQARRADPEAARVQVVAPDASRVVLLDQGKPPGSPGEPPVAPPSAPAGEIPPPPRPRPAAPGGAAAKAPREERPGTALLAAVREAGGLDPSFAMDFAGDNAAVVSRRLPGLFRRGGMTPDALAEWLLTNDYLSAADVRKADASAVGGSQGLAFDMLRRALQDGDVRTMYEREGAITRREETRANEEVGYEQYKRDTDPAYRAEREAAERAAMEQAAREWDLKPEEAADVDYVARARAVDAELVERLAADADAGRLSDAGFMDEMRRIGDEAKSQPQEVAGRDPVRGVVEAEAAAPEGRPAFDLEQPTETGLRAADLERLRADEQRRRVEEAPPPEEFRLTGSERPRDVGAAAGQSGLFEQREIPKPPEPAPKAPERGAGGAGTLSMNAMFDPQLIKDTLGKLGDAIPKRFKGAANAFQSMPESADRAGATVWQYSNQLAAAAERAAIDRDVARKSGAEMGPMLAKELRAAVDLAQRLNRRYEAPQPKTVIETIRAIEQAKREAAKMRMQRELYEQGYVVKAKEGASWEEFVRSDLPASTRDLIGPDGQMLRIRKDAKAVIEQVIGAHDVAAQAKWNRSLGGAIEGVSHALVRLPMINPMFHAVTTGGKAIAYLPPGATRNSIMSPEITKRAYEQLNDRAALEDWMQHGMRPWPRRGNMEELGAEMGRVEKTLRDAGFEKPYEAWQFIHNRLLGNIVNFMQLSAANMRYLQQVREAKEAGKTVTPEMDSVFKAAAARDSNLVGGMLPKGDVALWVYRAAGIGEFSRGLTTSTIKQITRALEGDRVIRAYAQAKGYTPAEAKKIMESNRDYMRASLLLDYVMMVGTANAINYWTTRYYDEPDKDGKTGGHFVHQNQGAQPSEKFFPRRIFIKPELGKDGERTGRQVVMGVPIRNTRDMIEIALAPFEYALNTDEKPKILKNKASIPVQIASEVASGKDWAGRKLTGAAEMGAAALSHVMPTPIGDLPMVALESMRMESGTFFEDSLKRMFEPANAGLALAGMQPRLSSVDPETQRGANKQAMEEEKVWSRARRLKQLLNSAEMSDESRASATESVLSDARGTGMEPKGVRALQKYLTVEGPSRGRTRKAQVQFQRERPDEIPAPPPGVD